MKICIIGAGLTGLTAAHALSGNNEVDILEKTSMSGGCLSSYRTDRYYIERYYHHCFEGDDRLFSLLNQLGLKNQLEWHNGTTGYYSRDTIYPLNTPLEILRYPELSLFDKARLAWLTIRAKGIDTDALDSVTAEDYIVRHLGKRIYSSFFEPLLRSKFGARRSEISAAWLISRVKIRSNRGSSGERLGYLKGGFHLLIEGLESSITSRGGRLFCNNPATVIKKTGEGWQVNGTGYDAVLSTIPPQELGKAGGPATIPVPYQGAACMTLALDRQVTNGIYWLNMKDEAPYGAVVSHTNFIPAGEYGEHLVYLGSYFTGMIRPDLDRLMLDDFRRRFSVSDNSIHWSRLAIDQFAGPVYTTGFRDLIQAYGEEGLFMAGMFSRPNYPERSMEGSVIAGFDVAEIIDPEGSR
ncbi:MAG TPA: NAD(P)/FAD-dependent oxidoreductase [Methanoregulaceae archaeon]|nr:NAD(P)/FAD-dependent oxidoreductase [Methanoregulaceae archaeon]